MGSFRRRQIPTICPNIMLRSCYFSTKKSFLRLSDRNSKQHQISLNLLGTRRPNLCSCWQAVAKERSSVFCDSLGFLNLCEEVPTCATDTGFSCTSVRLHAISMKAAWTRSSGKISSASHQKKSLCARWTCPYLRLSSVGWWSVE